MSKLQLLIFSVLLLGGGASCTSEDVSADTTKAATYKSNIADIDTYIASQTWTVKPTSVTSNSGLYFALTKPSTSTVSPQEGQELEFIYTLSILTSTTATSSSATSTTVVTAKVVDTVYAKNPIFIPYKKGILKAGLEEGLLKMHEGEQAVLLMPSLIGYGDVLSSDGLVPANSPLRFDVTLNRARTEDQQMDEYAASNSLNLTQKTSTGLRFFLTTPSTSVDSVKTALGKAQTVTIRYAAKQLHAKTVVRFDTVSSASLTSTNLTNLVAGFAEGIVKLKVGDKATFLMPSSLGYKDAGVVDKSTTPAVYKVSPYAPLRYDVEVLSVK
ncbi:hypothetical protein GCM10028808_26380 [Spirosoma migulaei]